LKKLLIVSLKVFGSEGINSFRKQNKFLQKLCKSFLAPKIESTTFKKKKEVKYLKKKSKSTFAPKHFFEHPSTS